VLHLQNSESNLKQEGDYQRHTSRSMMYHWFAFTEFSYSLLTRSPNLFQPLQNKIEWIQNSTLIKRWVCLLDNKGICKIA
jgi:hypothetical protein